MCKPKFCRNLLIFQYFKNNCAYFARLYLRKEAPDYAQIFRINPLDHTQDGASEKIQKIETLFFDPLNPDCHLKWLTIRVELIIIIIILNDADSQTVSANEASSVQLRA